MSDFTKPQDCIESGTLQKESSCSFLFSEKPVVPYSDYPNCIRFGSFLGFPLVPGIYYFGAQKNYRPDDELPYVKMPLGFTRNAAILGFSNISICNSRNIKWYRIKYLAVDPENVHTLHKLSELLDEKQGTFFELSVPDPEPVMEIPIDDINLEDFNFDDFDL